MNRSLFTRVRRTLAIVAGVLAVAFASLSVVPPPAQGDSNEGGVVVNPANRARQAKISAGGRHSCAVIGSTSSLWCWGDNASGQLGDGTTTPRQRPVRVVGPSVLAGFTAVSAGADHTCALLAGAARCWGENGSGQLGNGSTTDSSFPVVPSGGHMFLSISAGDGYTCGTTNNSQVLCWGRNSNGQLGNGNFTTSLVPTPAFVPGGAVLVTAGRTHTCATTGGGSAWCWGNNSRGQLGIGFASGPVPQPQQVQAFNVDAITAGELSTCAIAAGGTKCWGSNDWGQLGNGLSGQQVTPTNIGGGSNTLEQAITAGYRHACGRQGLRIRCWGSDDDGQLGNGAGGFSSLPVEVTTYTGSEIPAVTAGAHHTCTQLQLGQVDCFGDNAAGQVGNGTTTDAPSPVRVIAFPGVPTSVDTAVTYGSIKVTWAPPANAGGLPVKNYRIYDQEGTVDVLAAGDATSSTLTGLNPGQTYTLRIAAINELGEGQPVLRTPITMPTQPVISVSDVSYAEGNSGTKNMTFTLTRSGPLGATSSVKAATQNGTAVAPGDYTAKALTTISFAAGQSTKTFVVATKGDLLTEDSESFNVVLSSPVGAQVYDSTGTGTLVNDDPGEKPVYSIGGASALEGNAGTKYLTFTITRSGSTAVAGSVQYLTQALSGQATPTTDYTTKATTTMSFPVGAVTKTFTVAIKGDLVAEDDEFFQVVLKNPVNGDLATFPFDYGQIINDDSSATPSIAVNDVSITEGDSFTKNVTFTVTRSGNLAGTTAFKYATQNGTAIAPGDYTAKALTSLSFTAGQTSKTITVTIKGDTVPEPDEMFSVVLSAVTGGTIADGTGTATITNDD